MCRGHRTARALSALAAVASLFTAIALAPDQPRSQEPEHGLSPCGTTVSPEEAVSYLKSLSQTGPLSAPSSPGPYCIPIAAHIVRTSAGAGGMPLSQLTQAIDDANHHFANTGMVFYVLSLDYIDDNYFYSDITTDDDVNALRNTNVVEAAINVYFTPTTPGFCGSSTFAFMWPQGIVMNNFCTGLPSNPTTFSHEIGHYFNLFHTHTIIYDVELVDGSNCTTAGDLICDTPADPYLSNKVDALCRYTMNEKDPNGDPYDPDVSQLMSYARSTCRSVFSPQSEALMLNSMVTSRIELLARGCEALPVATVAGVTPSQGFQGQTLDVVVVGSSFRQFTSVRLGPGISVNAADTLSTSDSLLVNLTIDVNTPPGPVDIVVTNGLWPDTLEAAFEVLVTRRHYVSADGGNVYPYARAQDAATSLENAVSAARAGDSVLVDTSSVASPSLIINKPLELSGGWSNDFAARNTELFRTPLSLAGNILINHPGEFTTIDGFVLQNGRGSSGSSPIPGNYGGALRVVSAGAVIRNCEIRLNTANAGAGFGGGGAVFAANAHLVVRNCRIHDNEATRGGAVFLYQSSALLADNTIESNNAVVGGSSTPGGAGIAIEDCSSVTMTGNALLGNTGARDGGGLWISDTGTATLSGGEVSDHEVTNAGAGVFATHSTLSLNDVTFSRNESGSFGGAVAAGDSSTAVVRRCRFRGNTALAGAGVMSEEGDAFVVHNLFVGNSASFTGGAVYLSSVGEGVLQGNTVDSNTASAGVGGVFFLNAPISVFNNIVVNSVGDGLGCSGAKPDASYNLVWNSSGSDYVDLIAGTGSLSLDPLFANTSASDYHLMLNSPAIDAGEPSATNNDPDGSRGDMGYYGSLSHAMEQPSYPKDVVVQPLGGDIAMSWRRNPEGHIDYYAVYSDTVDGFLPSSGTLIGMTAGADTLLILPAPSDTAYYRVSAVDIAGYASGYSTQANSLPIASSVGKSPTPVNRLEQNVPNPFNPATVIQYSVAQSSRVRLEIYDVRGRHVRTLVDKDAAANDYRVVWDGRNQTGNSVSSGVYFYRLVAGSFRATKKMVLLR